jgi:hypothetical protein
VAVAPTIAEAAGILAEAATAVAQIEDERDQLFSQGVTDEASIAALTAERDALQAKLDLLDPDVPYWSDDFAGSWLTRWNVGDRNGLDKVAPTADGKGLHVDCAKGSLGIFGAHASPFLPCEHAIVRFALTMDDDWDWALTAGKSCGLGGTLHVPNRWSPGAGGKRWEHGLDTGAKLITASSETDANLKRATGFMVKALFGKYETAHLYIYGPGHVGTKSSSSYFGQTIPGTTAAKLDMRPGAKQHLEIETRLNTPGKADGYVGLKLQDVLVAKTAAGNLRSELHPDLKITQALLNHQFGGGPADAPTRDTGLTISDVSVERLG